MVSIEESCPVYTRDPEHVLMRAVGIFLAAAPIVGFGVFRLAQADDVTRMVVVLAVTLFALAILRRVRASDVASVMLLLVMGAEIWRNCSLEEVRLLPLIYQIGEVAAAGGLVSLLRSRSAPRRRASDVRRPAPPRQEIHLQAWVVGPAA
jgi:hypothetical protein